MNLSAIWNKQARVNLWSVQKLTSACLSQIALEQSCDYVLIIYMENTRLPIIIKHKQSARIKCKNNNLFKPCVRSKQSRTIKTIICSYIFTSLRRKKVQSPAKQFKELFSLCPNHFRWNGCTTAETKSGPGGKQYYAEKEIDYNKNITSPLLEHLLNGIP